MLQVLTIDFQFAAAVPRVAYRPFRSKPSGDFRVAVGLSNVLDTVLLFGAEEMSPIVLATFLFRDDQPTHKSPRPPQPSKTLF
jgi:hypothetical protein